MEAIEDGAGDPKLGMFTCANDVGGPDGTEGGP